VIVRKGQVLAEEVPAPRVSEGCALIRVSYSCISAGTEISSVQSSGRSLISRAIERPEKIMKFLARMGEAGPVKTFKEVIHDNSVGAPIGYSLSGMIIGLGKQVNSFCLGEKVAAVGGGFAHHAEFVDVPTNLIVKMPQDIDMVAASSVALGGIALQGIRRARLSMGEFAVVFGTGIIGLLTVQLMKAAGIRVLAIDLDERRLGLAKALGAELISADANDAVRAVNDFTGGHGADAVLFTAATSSSQPLSQAFRMCRKKGRVVMVGVSGMDIKREDIYQKELDFAISTSYGPGRYDPVYEEEGLDYPYAYVRWTENRNMQEYLRRVRIGDIDVTKLIDGVYPIAQASAAFDALQHCEPKPLITILDYTQERPQASDLTAVKPKQKPVLPRALQDSIINIALVGAGSFAQQVHLPNLSQLPSKYRLHTIMGKRSYNAQEIAKRFSFGKTVEDYQEILEDPDVDLILICTRHSSHYDLVIRALEAGKNVFVEKPLCITRQQLESIKSFYRQNHASGPLLHVGYNRRFSRYAREIMQSIKGRVNPLYIIYRMNAGYLPPDHWVHREGGRIVGEACHLVDLMNYFTEAKITAVAYESLRPANDKISAVDNKAISLRYEDGSLATIHYFVVGNQQLEKEYMELHFDGKSIVLDDYKALRGFGTSIRPIKTNRSEKGHFEEMEAVYECLTGRSRQQPIELWDLFQTSEITLLDFN
jgi:predicted dehydrogenase/threonine dehydrogenase-like Zn-dependent dehydrogenase